MMRGAEDKAFERGYFLLTANTDEQIARERKIVSALRSYRVDGLLLAAAPGKELSHIRSTMQAGIPVVFLDRTVAGIKADAVVLHNVHGGFECVRHLLSIGHTRIGIITGSLDVLTGRERLRGYDKALRDAGIDIDQDLILEGNFREESGYKLGKNLLRIKPRPSAIFVCNGLMTLGALKAFEELGVRCPEDVAIATFDDLVADRSFHPHLTVVAQPGYEMGARAATILMDRIEGKLTKGPSVVRITPTLVIRESTKLGRPLAMANGPL
jgi:LacI family transcriptional regulator